jgi:hypothetical protein
MRSGFERWMEKTEEKTPGVVKSYSTAINRISQHYSKETGRRIDIYKIKDISLLKEICTEYKTGGRFEYFGNENHGLYRAAISAYVRYFEKTGGDDNGINGELNFSVSDSKIKVKKNSTGRMTVSISLVLDEVKK